jgi:hypothetical protein
MSGLMTAEPASPSAWSVEPAAPAAPTAPADADATSPGFGYPETAPELLPAPATAAPEAPPPSLPRLDDLDDQDEPAAGSGPDDDSELLLPRRVRQASLAPQLRDESLAAPVSTDAGTSENPDEGRSPDEVRATMSAIQQGWQRGRSVFDPPDRGRGPAAGDQDDAGSPAEPTGSTGRPKGKN